MKQIIIQTIPHTGTHTLMYLLTVLGKLPTWWHHWNKNCIQAMEFLLEQDDLSNMVFVRTFRDEQSTEDSYRRRDGDRGSEQYKLHEKLWEKYFPLFPCGITIPIEANNAVKTRAIMSVFKAIETDVPPAVLEYMKTWPKLGVYGQGTIHGVLDEKQWIILTKFLEYNSLQRPTVRDRFTEENTNGT